MDFYGLRAKLKELGVEYIDEEESKDNHIWERSSRPWQQFMRRSCSRARPPKIPRSSMPISPRCANWAGRWTRRSPTLAIVIGSDHLETFFLSAVPTFAIIAGKTSQASFAGRDYDLPIHPLAEELLDKLVARGFDMAYSQDAVLGHSFAAVYEWVIEGREIPVVPVFVNTYLPPLPAGAPLRSNWARRSAK